MALNFFFFKKKLKPGRRIKGGGWGYSHGLFYARNYSNIHTSKHEVCIISVPVYHGYGTLVISARVFMAVRYWSSRHGCFMVVRYLSSRHGYLMVVRYLSSRHKEKGGQKTLPNASYSPHLLILPSPMFSVAFENHIFSHLPCIRALFLSPPAVTSYQTTHTLR